MDWVIYLFGSGLIFFIGAGFLGAAILLVWLSRPRWLAKSASVFVIVGLLLITLSATPLPYWLYAIAGGTTVFWLIAEEAKSSWFVGRRRLLRACVAIVWFVAVFMEIPHHVAPSPNIQGRPKLYVMGDSVTAGTGEQGLETWPRILERTRTIEVIDFSRMGATVGSALRQAEPLPPTVELVLLQIGGNDVLGSTPVAKFEQNLERLLNKVAAAGRVVLMFELPLPPFQNDYGRVQRRLAAEYGVLLIPKRIFTAVLTAPGATVDSVHLSKTGHERMAEAVWSLIHTGYAD